MSADWQLGDLALCVDDGPVKDVCGNGGRETQDEYVAQLRVGRVYTVDRIVRCLCGNHIALGDCKERAGGVSTRFVKVTPGAEIIGVEAENRLPEPVA